MKILRFRLTIRALLLTTAVLAAWFATMVIDARHWEARRTSIALIRSNHGIFKAETVGDYFLRKAVADDGRFQQVTHIWFGPGIDGHSIRLPDYASWTSAVAR